MRKVLRAEIKAAPDARIAVVCGAWHAPALVPADFPPVARDRDLLIKLPRTKVAAAWTPWTAERPPARGADLRHRQAGHRPRLPCRLLTGRRMPARKLRHPGRAPERVTGGLPAGC